jgi:hypothetical protein
MNDKDKIWKVEQVHLYFYKNHVVAEVQLSLPYKPSSNIKHTGAPIICHTGICDLQNERYIEFCKTVQEKRLFSINEIEQL